MNALRNSVRLIGHLGDDPKVRKLDSGKTVANFSIATNEIYRDKSGEKQSETTWHRIVAWGKQAELLKQYLTKGREVYLEGRIANRSYDDKDGNKRYISEVVVQNFQFVGSRADSGGDAPPSPSASSPAPTPNTAGDDDDLPF